MKLLSCGLLSFADTVCLCLVFFSASHFIMLFLSLTLFNLLFQFSFYLSTYFNSTTLSSLIPPLNSLHPFSITLFPHNPPLHLYILLLSNPSPRVYVTWALWTWSVCSRPQRKCLWWWRSSMVTCWRWSSPVKKADCLRGLPSSSSLRCVCTPVKKGFVCPYICSHMKIVCVTALVCVTHCSMLFVVNLS